MKLRAHVAHLFSLPACLIHFSPAATLGTSVSPYHEVMRMERRLRSSSEGAGGPRVHGNHRDVVGMEGCGLLKHRNNSSSSKMGSLVGCFCPLFTFELGRCNSCFSKIHFMMCISMLVIDNLSHPNHIVIVFSYAEKCVQLAWITRTLHTWFEGRNKKATSRSDTLLSFAKLKKKPKLFCGIFN